MSTKTHLVAEIGLLLYPDCQLSAIYGLTDVEGGDKPGQWNASDLLSVAV